MILAPLMLVVIGLIVSLGRLGLAKTRVQDAAGAAVAATVAAATPAAAGAAARRAVRSDLAAEGLRCSSISLTLDLGDFRPGGRVSAHVSCRVPLSSATVPGLPGSLTLAAASAGPVDPYRNPT